MCPKQLDIQVVEEPTYSWRKELPEAAHQTVYREPWLAQGVETKKAPVKGRYVQDEQRPTTDWESLEPVLTEMGIGTKAGRCTVCHTPGTVKHPQWTGDSHPSEKFSCLACHDGSHFGKDDGFDHNGNRLLKKGLTEMTCGKCHMEASIAGAANLSIGRDLLWKYGCATCHDLDIPKFQERYAPRLDYVGGRLTSDELDRWIANPRAVQANAKMPQVVMEDEERQAIVAFLGSLRKDLPDPPADGGVSGVGMRLFAQRGCKECHSGVMRAGQGPDLLGGHARGSKAWLFAFLKNPGTIRPDTPMPSQGFRDDEVADVIAFLEARHPKKSLPARVPPSDASEDLVGTGLSLFAKMGCASCHIIDGLRRPDTNFKPTQESLEGYLELAAAHYGGEAQPMFAIPQNELNAMAMALSSWSKEPAPDDITLAARDGTEWADYWNTDVVANPIPSAMGDIAKDMRPPFCGSCHVDQFNDWRGSFHHKAYGAGLHGQVVGKIIKDPESCKKCHQPRGMGTIICAACHVSGHQRFGPEPNPDRIAAMTLRPGSHGTATTQPSFGDANFCGRCHQFKPNGNRVNGKLLENTVEEWRESPHAQRGETCKSCHMPDRKHSWKGIHDPKTVRDALKLAISPKAPDGGVTITLTNEGAGHMLPTYVTPLIYVEAVLLDAKDKPIDGSLKTRAAGRSVILRKNEKREIFDTRIPPGGTWKWTYKAKASNAKKIRVRVACAPDAFYRKFFESWLSHDKLPDEKGRTWLERAHKGTVASPYGLFDETRDF